MSKSKREVYEEYLSGVYPVSNQALDDALEEALEEANACGFDAAVSEIADGSFEHPRLKDLRERFHYLKLGGEWDLLTTDARNVYLAGFEDAMKTLGVKP